MKRKLETMRRAVPMAVMVALTPLLAAAQGQPGTAAGTAAAVSPAEATAAAMAKVHFLLGRWEGEGSMRRGPGDPQRSQVIELATAKLGGRVVVLEGLGTAPGAAGEAPRVVHEAYGVLSYDAVKGAYLLRAITGEGHSVDADVEVGERRIVWSFATPHGRVRYTLALDEQGRWVERGEHSRDGASWSPFFDMTLRRVGDA
jgi:hypothetical protein